MCPGTKSSIDDHIVTEDAHNDQKHAKTESVNVSTTSNETTIDPHKEFGIATTYVNMNVVEKEKLAWMKRLPEVSIKRVG